MLNLVVRKVTARLDLKKRRIIPASETQFYEFTWPNIFDTVLSKLTPRMRFQCDEVYKDTEDYTAHGLTSLQERH
jgi:hypothetical protein